MTMLWLLPCGLTSVSAESIFTRSWSFELSEVLEILEIQGYN